MSVGNQAVEPHENWSHFKKIGHSRGINYRQHLVAQALMNPNVKSPAEAIEWAEAVIKQMDAEAEQRYADAQRRRW